MMLFDYVEDHPIIDAIRNYFEENYGKKYTKRIFLYNEYTSYTVAITLNRNDKPLFIGGDFETDDDFIAYSLKELRARNLPATEYFTLVVTTPENI